MERNERGRQGRAEIGEKEGRDGVRDGAGSASKLKLGLRTIFLAPALWKAHSGLPISVN